MPRSVLLPNPERPGSLAVYRREGDVRQLPDGKFGVDVWVPAQADFKERVFDTLDAAIDYLTSDD